MVNQTLSFIILVSIPNSIFGQSKLKLDSGARYEIKIFTESNATSETMGQTMDVKSGVTLTSATNVISAGSNEIVLQTTITGANGFIDYNGQKADFDSDKNKMNGPVADSYKKILNRSFTRIFDASGSIKEMKGTNKASDIDIAALKQSGINTNDPGIFKKGLIGRNLRAGEKWSDSSLVTGKMETKTLTFYEVISADHLLGVIRYTSEEEFNGVVERMGMEVNMQGKRKSRGTYTISMTTLVIETHRFEGESESILELMGNEVPNNTYFSGSTSVIKKQ